MTANAVLTVCFTIFLQAIAMEPGVLDMYSVLLFTVLLAVIKHHQEAAPAVVQTAFLDNKVHQDMNH